MSPKNFSLPDWMAAPLCKLLAVFMAFIDPAHSLKVSSLMVSVILPLFLRLQPHSPFVLSIFRFFPLPQDPIYSAFSHHTLAQANLTLTLTSTLTNLPVLPDLSPNSLRILDPYFQLIYCHMYRKHDIRRAEHITLPPTKACLTQARANLDSHSQTMSEMPEQTPLYWAVTVDK